jgi:hypothetical protein
VSQAVQHYEQWREYAMTQGTQESRDLLVQEEMHAATVARGILDRVCADHDRHLAETQLAIVQLLHIHRDATIAAFLTEKARVAPPPPPSLIHVPQ